MNQVEDRKVALPADPRRAELAIIGSETADHTVPTDVLVRALEGLQRIIYLIAAADEHRPIDERFGMNERFRERYTLRCGVPEASSFALPVALEDDLVEAPDESLLIRTLELFRLASDKAFNELGRMIPDPKYLPRILNGLQAMLPRPGDRWSVALSVGSERVALDSGVYRAIREYTAPSSTEDAVTTITGDLVRVDFDKSRIVIRYAPTGEEIPCYCEVAVLDALVQDWFMPIQVTGRFTLDPAGNPRKLTRVTRVEPVDLSPMTFDRIDWGGRRLEIDPPLTFEPTMDEESGQFYILTDDDLGINVFARNREQLADELAEQLMFQWDAYAEERPERLTPAAGRLRDALRKRMREGEFAARPEVR